MTDPFGIIDDIKALIEDIRNQTSMPVPEVSTFTVAARIVRRLGIKVDDNIKDDAMVQVVTTNNEVTVTEIE